MKVEKILISKRCLETDDVYETIQGVIDFVNAMREGGLSPDDLIADAIESYFLDFYSTQFSNGAFSQFVYNSGSNQLIYNSVQNALAKIGAKENLKFYQKCREIYLAISEDELESFFAGEYFGENKTRDKLDVYKWEFFDIKKVEDLDKLHSDWIKSSDVFVAVDQTELAQKIENIVRGS